MSETIILGGGGGGRTNQSLLNSESGNVEKPMLGRYQVEKELGKGAMGVVYLGKDPKIGRVVADQDDGVIPGVRARRIAGRQGAVLP